MSLGPCVKLDGTGSKLITSAGAGVPAKEYIGASLKAGTGDSASLLVYDGTSASGALLDILGASTFGGDHSPHLIPVQVSSGIYAELVGTGAQFVVYFN